MSNRQEATTSYLSQQPVDCGDNVDGLPVYLDIPRGRERNQGEVVAVWAT